MELIDGDAINYGYRKITYYLRKYYNLTINPKKIYRLCKEFNILKNQRVITYYQSLRFIENLYFQF